MKIKITHGGTDYTINNDGYSFTVIRHSIIQDKKSANFGKPTDTTLSYPTSLAGAVSRIIKDTIGSSDEVVTLKEYCERVEAANADIRQQLEGVA